ncbi:MAG: hypothetical protein R3E97_02825 [Candidatus Eisenbacteria bacterium]
MKRLPPAARPARPAWPPRLFAFASLALVCTAVCPVFGNGGPIDDSSGNQIVPLTSTEVQLVRESVRITCGSTGWVTCNYVLRNLTSNDIDLSIGFVRGQGLTEGRGRDFKAWVEADPASVRWLRTDLDRWEPFAGGDLDSLPVWDVQIPGDDTVGVRCVYPVAWDGDGDIGSYSTGLTYHTKAAALWAGVIERAEFEIELFGDLWRFLQCTDPTVPPYVAAEIAPPGYWWNGHALYWKFENWEPTEDIRIGLFEVNLVRWQDFLKCARLSSADCGILLQLPPYVGDTDHYTEASVLEGIRDGFIEQGWVYPIASNYEAFAQAYLLALRLEMQARHGATFDEAEEEVAYFFESQFWYAPEATYDHSQLTETELANERFLEDLRPRIVGHPERLLPLPPQR